METSSAQEWPKLGNMVDRDFVGFSEPTAEQLEVLMGYHNNFAAESLTSTLTGYPRNLKLPTTVSQLGARPSAGSLGYERPAKQSKANNSEDSSSQCQQRFSGKISTPLPICVPNFQQKPQHIQLDNYFRDLLKPKAHQTYESLALTTPCMQTEILGSGAHDHSCISDISHSICHSNNDGPSDMQISSVPARSRQSNQLQNKASGNSQDHIMAERKRREKLGQRFIALSAIVPGLKKMDKISVLGDAIKYVKQLQDKIKRLEEQTPKTTVQSVVYVKKKEIRNDYDEEDSDKVSSPSFDSSADKDVPEGGVVLTPEIDIRVTNRNVLIHAHCQKRKGLLPKFVAELDALQLTVVNANILSFSEATFDLTFNAQMEEGCKLTVRDILKSLQALFKKMTDMNCSSSKY